MALVLAAILASAWLDIPFVPQSGNGCGAACIAMVLRYWDPAAAPDPDLLKRQLAAKAEGIRAADVEDYFRTSGFQAYAFRGNWTDLEHHIAKGRPLIVSLGTGDSALAHYVVVAGIDSGRELVFVNDPAGTKLAKQHRAAFERRWQESGCWTLLALPGNK